MEMEISDKEILHIADLASLKIDEKEIEKYKKNLQDILNFANIINNTDTKNLDVSIGTNENYNVFREDEIKEFEDKKALLQNAEETENNMFKIPRVL